LEKSIWKIMLKRAFDVDDTSVPLQQARQVVYSLSSKLLQADKVNAVKAKLDALGPSATNEAKHTVLQDFIFDCWMTSLAELGYKGDDAYVRFQAALIDHSTDTQISTLVQSSMMSITSSLGIGGGDHAK
jgi:hypothetical protein